MLKTAVGGKMEAVICIHGPQISDSKGFEMQAPFREHSLHARSFHRLPEHMHGLLILSGLIHVLN